PHAAGGGSGDLIGAGGLTLIVGVSRGFRRDGIATYSSHVAAILQCVLALFQYPVAHTVHHQDGGGVLDPGVRARAGVDPDLESGLAGLTRIGGILGLARLINGELHLTGAGVVAPAVDSDASS